MDTTVLTPWCLHHHANWENPQTFQKKTLIEQKNNAKWTGSQWFLQSAEIKKCSTCLTCGNYVKNFEGA